MKKGFQLLHTRSLDNPVGEYDIQLPEKCRLFVETFDVGNNSLFKESSFDSINNKKGYILTCFYEPMEDIFFVGFNTIQKAIEVKYDLEEYEFSRYLPIGYSSYDAGIIVSLEGDDKDVIYFDDASKTYFNEDTGEIEGLVKLNDNIFDFVRGLELRVNSYHDDIDTSTLYKNWHEGFWRLPK